MEEELNACFYGILYTLIENEAIDSCAQIIQLLTYLMVKKKACLKLVIFGGLMKCLE